MAPFILAASESGDGNPIPGLLFLAFIGWIVYMICKPKNKGYNLHVESRGKITRRR